MNYHHLYEMVNFHLLILFKSFFSDGVINPSAIFFSMKFSFISCLHCICRIVYMLTRRCPDPWPSHTSLFLVYDIVISPAHRMHFSVLTSPSIPSSQEIPTLVHQKLPAHLSSLIGKTVSLWKSSPSIPDPFSSLFTASFS